MTRNNYTIALEITPIAPITHGMGTDGNMQVHRAHEVLVAEDDPEVPGSKRWSRLRVPCVSGSSFRAALREHAFGWLAEVLELKDGDVSLDALRLLLKGGKNDSGGQSVSLEEARRLRDLFPMLAVFGSMDGGLPIRGELRVSPIQPWCAELVEAGLAPREVSMVEVAVDGATVERRTAIELFPGAIPVPLRMCLTEVEYFRHDLKTSPHVHLLGDGTRGLLEDKAAARKGGSATAEVRREANESMPHSAEAIPPGTPMWATIRLLGATPVEWECLAHAIARWVAHGALLGGATGKGHGACKVRVAGALVAAATPGVAAPPGTALSTEQIGSAYVEHVRSRAEACRAELGKATRGATATPTVKGKGKGKATAEAGEEVADAG